MANALIAIEERLYAQQGVAARRRVARVDGGRPRRGDPRGGHLPHRPRRRHAGPRLPGRASTSPSRWNCPTAPVRYASTASRARPAPPCAPHRSSGYGGRRRARRARSPGTCTHGCARATGCGSRRRTAIWCSTAPTPRCSSPRRASAAPRCCRCWSIWRRRAHRSPSPWCTATGHRPTTPCARTTAALTGQALRRLRPLLVREAGARPGRRGHGAQRYGRPERRPGRPGHPRVPVRTAALHARRTHPAAGEGCAVRRHPLRGVRPRPVARQD